MISLAPLKAFSLPSENNPTINKETSHLEMNKGKCVVCVKASKQHRWGINVNTCNNKIWLVSANAEVYFLHQISSVTKTLSNNLFYSRLTSKWYQHIVTGCGGRISKRRLLFSSVLFLVFTNSWGAKCQTAKSCRLYLQVDAAAAIFQCVSFFLFLLLKNSFLLQPETNWRNWQIRMMLKSLIHFRPPILLGSCCCCC